MSPLTKAFVVLVTVLSILLVTLVVPFVHRVDALNEAKVNAETVAKASEASINNLQDQLGTLRESLGAKDVAMQNAITSAEAQVAQAQGKVTALEAKLAKAEADNLAIQATMESSAAAQVQNAELLSAATQELRNTQTKLVDRSTENTQLIARNNQLQSDLSALERQVRKLREQNVALSEENANLERAVVAGGGEIPQAGAATAAVPVSGDPIYGQVTGKEAIPGGNQLVMVNVGKNDGVVPNQRFVAYRGQNELVAMLEIKTVDASEAVAVVLNEQTGIITGDYVVSASGL